MPTELTLADFDYALPPELIAQFPLARRDASRLLHVRMDGLADFRFNDIERLLAPDDLLVFNDTRVIKARLFGRKPSGGKVEALIERVLEPTRALALLRTSHSPATGATILFGSDSKRVVATVLGRREDFFELDFESDVLQILEAFGHVPLPPYIAHADADEDIERYQTVYARHAGAVAAPTAGLHFTSDLLERLRARGNEIVHLTLHVGAGTFQPVRTETIEAHQMHSESFRLEPAAAAAINAARAAGRRVAAVGTTTLRALESSAMDGLVQAGARDTRLFITPGFRFQIVDRLLTNFHLPRSTLLMLVSAFAGIERIRLAYAHAIAQRYRFFSYGDAMLLERAR